MVNGQWRMVNVFQQLAVVELPVPAVDFWNLCLQVSQITLRQAAHDVKPFNAPFVLGLGKLQDGVDALLLGIGNEATGVDDDYLTLPWGSSLSCVHR